MPIINIANAQIKTASVEIKTLSVSGRQVTLSLFKQIIDESIIDETNMKLNGTPWGLVNYFIKDDLSQFKINIVWQKGSELRRCAILRSAYIRDEFREIRTETCADIDYEIRRHRGMIKDIEQGDFYLYGNNEKINNCYYIKPLLKYIESTKQDIEHYEKQTTCQSHVESLNEYLNIANNRLNVLYEHLNDIKDKLHMNEEKRKLYIQKYDELLKPLLDLPHLFIAV